MTATKSKLQYSWREDSRVRGDAQEIGQALEELSESTGRPVNGLTADDVVEAARDTDSPLHRIVFATDDETAAHEHRKDIARLILRSIRITVIQDGKERQAINYVNVRVADQGPMYVPTSLAHRQEDMRIQMMENAQSGINGWLARYRSLDGVSEVFELIEKASKVLGTKIENAKTKTTAKAGRVPLRRDRQPC